MDHDQRSKILASVDALCDAEATDMLKDIVSCDSRLGTESSVQECIYHTLTME